MNLNIARNTAYNFFMIYRNRPYGLLEHIKSFFRIFTLKELKKRIGINDIVLSSTALVFFVFYLYMSCCRTEIVIYHGPYSAYTPISLQKRIQDEYDKKIPIWNLRYLLKAMVASDETSDYLSSWQQQMAEKKSTRENRVYLYTMNTGTWINPTYLEDIDSGKISKKWQNGNLTLVKNLLDDSLEIIGYKKQDILYYMPLFIWHKDSLLFGVDSALESGRQLVLNRKKGSGCSNMVPTVFLLEKYGEIPSFVLSKQNVVKEVLTKKQLVGVISTDEYDAQLDENQKGNLFIEPIPVNIPLDPIIVRRSEWNRSKRVNEKSKNLLIQKNVMIDVASQEGRKMHCLGEMLYFYLSMPIICACDSPNKAKIIYWGLDDFKNRLADTTSQVVAYLCKVNYACLGKEYYSFDVVDCCFGSITGNEYFILNNIDSASVANGYKRIVFADQKKRFDDLQKEYNECFR